MRTGVIVPGTYSIARYYYYTVVRILPDDDIMLQVRTAATSLQQTWKFGNCDKNFDIFVIQSSLASQCLPGKTANFFLTRKSIRAS